MFKARWELFNKEPNKDVLTLAVIVALAVGLLGYGASKINYEDSSNLPVPTQVFSTPEGER